MHLVERPCYPNRGWYNALTHWSPTELFKLGILCEADCEVEQSADALGRPPTTLIHKAREQGILIPSDWAKILTPPKRRVAIPKERRVDLAYPYIQKARPEHADVVTINSMIPAGIPEHMRSDICQEIMLAILEGRTTIEALTAKKGSTRYFIKKFYKDNFEDGGMAISFSGVDDDWNSDAVASSIAAKEWCHDRMAETATAYGAMTRTYTKPVQFEAAWRDQISRIQLKYHQLGNFLTEAEIEEILEEDQ